MDYGYGGNAETKCEKDAIHIKDETFLEPKELVHESYNLLVKQ